jgi:hypothetical protein
MATNFVYNRVNINGIPCIESRSITETTASVTFNFNTSPAVSSRFSGLIAIRIDEQAATSADALPVFFNVPSIAGTTIALTTFGGTAVTGVELQEGIHLVFYDRENGILQLLI